MLTQTSGSFLSGYLYRVSISLPWVLLSASMIVLGILFIALVNEPEKAEF
jgi:hypothetical protein